MATCPIVVRLVLVTLMHALYQVTRRIAGGSTPNGVNNIPFPHQEAHRQANLSARPPRTHQTQLIVDKLAMGLRAAAAKADAEGRKTWITEFCHRDFPDCKGDGKKLALQKKRVWSAMKEASSKDVGSLARCASKSLALALSKRKRKNYKSPRFVNEVVREELFAWFVDSIDNVRGRIPSFIILAQAEIIAQDYKDAIRKKIEIGELEPSFIFKMPFFTHQWLLLWRRQFNLSWRTINLRFKVSWKKLLELLLIFHTNILKIRWLHYFLFDLVQCLRIINCDEKPFHFTSAYDAKSLSYKGSKKCAVIENLPMSRSRFTWKTRCAWPKLPADGKIGAVMFRGIGLEIKSVTLRDATR